MPASSFDHSRSSQPQSADPYETNPILRRSLERAEQRIACKSTLAAVARCMEEHGANPRVIKETIRGVYNYLKATGLCELPPITSPLRPSIFYIQPPTDEELLQSPIPNMFSAAQYVPRPTEWLWTGYIPLGALTLLEAAPSTGSSLLALTLAAHVSRGLPFPDYSPCPQGRVLIIAHDHAFTTIIPRLLAANADMTQISLLPTVEDLDTSCTDIVDRPFSIAHDLDLLSRAIRQLDPVLVIIDTQEHFSSDHYRTHLPKLNRLSELAGCSILLMRPITRPLTTANMRLMTAGGASPTLLHIVRSALRLIPSFDEDSSYLICIKHALSASPPDLPFDIVSQPASSFIPALSSSSTSHTLDSSQIPPEDLACSYAPSLPIIRWLPVDFGWPPPQGANALSPVPASLSAIRQDILACLEASPRPMHIPEIVEQIAHGYDAVRRALSRMRCAREVISPSRGIYTTPNHPSLTPAAQSASPDVHHPSQSSQPSQSPDPIQPVPDVSSPSAKSPSQPSQSPDPVQPPAPAHNLTSSSPSQTPQSTNPTQQTSTSTASQPHHPTQPYQPSQSAQSSQPDPTPPNDNHCASPNPTETKQ